MLFYLSFYFTALQAHSTSVAASTMLTGTAAAEAMKMSELIKYASIIVSSLPVMCLYPFVQKYFNKGVMIGSLKG